MTRPDETAAPEVDTPEAVTKRDASATPSDGPTPAAPARPMPAPPAPSSSTDRPAREWSRTAPTPDPASPRRAGRPGHRGGSAPGSPAQPHRPPARLRAAGATPPASAGPSAETAPGAPAPPSPSAPLTGAPGAPAANPTAPAAGASLAAAAAGLAAPAPYSPPGSPERPRGPQGVPPRSAPLPPPRQLAGIPARTPGPSGAPPRPAASAPRPASPPTAAGRGRRATLTLRRIDPWSVFLWSAVTSVFLGLALIVAAVVLYLVLSALGVTDSVNTLIGDVTSDPGKTATPSSFFSTGAVLGFTTVLALVNVVVLTGLATLGAFLYNVVAQLTGGIDLTLGDRD